MGRAAACLIVRTPSYLRNNAPVCTLSETVLHGSFTSNGGEDGKAETDKRESREGGVKGPARREDEQDKQDGRRQRPLPARAQAEAQR